MADSPQLTPGRKFVYSLGDHSLTVALASLSLVYLFFLTDVAGLRPGLAGLVIWIARIIDAFTDPLMGRLSDRTRTRWGRRRPYLLVGALPFSALFALLWQTPFTDQWAMFAYYTGAYVALSLAMTILWIPYVALAPEMAPTYDERTSITAYRAGANLVGILLAAGLQPYALALGADAAAYAQVGLLIAAWTLWPWPFVFRASFEREPVQPPTSASFASQFRQVLAHANFRRLTGFYLTTRIAMDLAGGAFVYFFTYWIRRPDDFGPTLAAMLLCSFVSLPFWVRAAGRYEKHHVFAAGAGWWAVSLAVFIFADASWPAWVGFAIAGSVGLGYGISDLMPWSMLGEVVDEGEAQTGERMDGIYHGVFTFIRKLGGASAFLIAGLVLDVSGYVRDQPQSESALWAIRSLLTLIPTVFLAISVWMALGYPLTRARHREVADALTNPGEAQDSPTR